MMRTETVRLLLSVAIATTVFAAASIAHPGHEYKVTGTVSKVRADVFEVTEADGAKTAFFIVPATEVRLGKDKGSVGDIKAGAKVIVEGIENDKGNIEAKLVRIS